MDIREAVSIALRLATNGGALTLDDLEDTPDAKSEYDEQQEAFDVIARWFGKQFRIVATYTETLTYRHVIHTTQSSPKEALEFVKKYIESGDADFTPVGSTETQIDYEIEEVP